MTKRTSLLACIALGLVLFPTIERAHAQELVECLRRTLKSPQALEVQTVGDQSLYARQALREFYERRGFAPAWMDTDARAAGGSRELIESIRGAAADALRPADYHLDRLEQQAARLEEGSLSPCQAAALDIAMSDAFLLLATHLLSGRLNPNTLDPEWVARPRQGRAVELLERAAEDGRVSAAIASQRPNAPGYERLRRALARYRRIEAAGGWDSVTSSASARDLAARLAATGDLKRRSGDAMVDTDSVTLAASLRGFQARHGLRRTGVADTATLRQLNVSAAERAAQLEVNLERWRWLPQDLGWKRVMVNIAGFDVQVFEDQNVVMEMRAIVGRTYRRTPVFSDEISYLVFSPYWTVPPGIARNDILPAVRKNVGYLAEKNMRVIREGVEVDPTAIDWKQVKGSGLPLLFRQDPGPTNALGPVKIMFPNTFNVYLHGTPAVELFDHDVRALSSGCIRLAQPLELAGYLLQDDPTWTKERIKAAGESGREQTVRLKERVPVHILYWTAWTDPDGTVQFRPDIYGRDAPVRNAMAERPPQATP